MHSNKENKGPAAPYFLGVHPQDRLLVEICRLEQAFFGSCVSNYPAEWNANFVKGSVKKQKGKKMGLRCTFASGAKISAGVPFMQSLPKDGQRVDLSIGLLER
jgi:hypothetical protein